MLLIWSHSMRVIWSGEALNLFTASITFLLLSRLGEWRGNESSSSFVTLYKWIQCHKHAWNVGLVTQMF